MQRLDRMSVDMVRYRFAGESIHDDDRAFETDRVDGTTSQATSRGGMAGFSRDLLLHQQQQLHQQQVHLVRRFEEALGQDDRDRPRLPLLREEPVNIASSMNKSMFHTDKDSKAAPPSTLATVSPHVHAVEVTEDRQEKPVRTSARKSQDRDTRSSKLPRASLYQRPFQSWTSRSPSIGRDKKMFGAVPLSGDASTDSRTYGHQQAPLQQNSSTSNNEKPAEQTVGNSVRRRESQPLDGRPFMQRIVDSNQFEFFFAALIISNSIFVGVQVDLPTGDQSTTLIIFTFQAIYAAFFTMELFMRVSAEGHLFFHWASQNIMWNCLDVVVVITSLIEIFFETLHFVAESADSKLPKGLSNVRVVRILRIVRLVRVVRIARVLRFIHALRTFIFSIIATLKALVWALFLLLMIMYVFGIILTQAVQEYCDPESGSEADPFYCGGPLGKYWGNLAKSMFTLFKSISGGLSWDDAVYPMHKVGPLWVLCFTCYISFTYLAVLNVVTGIFCQSAIETAQQNEDLAVQIQIANKQAYIDRIMKVFKTIDDDCSGAITKEELQEHLEDPDMEAVFSSLEIETADAETLFALLDADGGNEIEVDEFVKGLMRLRGNAKRADVVEIDARLKLLEKILGRIAGRLDEVFPRRSKASSENGAGSAHRVEELLLADQRLSDRAIKDGILSRGGIPIPTGSGGAPSHPPPQLQGVVSTSSPPKKMPNGEQPFNDVLPQEEAVTSRQPRAAVKRPVSARVDGPASRDGSRGGAENALEEVRPEELNKLAAAIEQCMDSGLEPLDVDGAGPQY